jgi:hypothetical protein
MWRRKSLRCRSTTMTTASTFDPSQRQILVNIGNRYVVFGPSPGLPEPLHFDPQVDSEILPRVADESDVTEARIVRTLRVSGHLARLSAGNSNRRSSRGGIGLSRAKRSGGDVDGAVSKKPCPSTRDRRFESTSLHRRVSCEPDFGAWRATRPAAAPICCWQGVEAEASWMGW